MNKVDLLGRRKFITGLGVAAGAAMVAPAMAISEKADGIKWDKEVEIVIIGSVLPDLQQCNPPLKSVRLYLTSFLLYLRPL